MAIQGRHLRKYSMKIAKFECPFFKYKLQPPGNCAALI